MLDRDSLERHFPIELCPKKQQINVWQGEEMRRIDLSNCDKVVIDTTTISPNTKPKPLITFHSGQDTSIFRLDRELFWISNVIINRPFEDRRVA